MPFSKLAKKLNTNKTVVIERWIKKVRERIEGAKDQPYVVLKDSIPEFLENLAHALGSNQPLKLVKGAEELGNKHGEERFFQNGFTLGQVVDEYSILRKELFKSLQEEMENHFESILIVNEAIDHGIHHAVETFSKFQRAADKAQVSDLKRINRTQDQLVANVSHDLRNPLGAAMMALDMLVEETEIPESGLEYKDMLVRNLGYASDIIQDLLDISGIKSGKKLALEFEQINLTTLISECVKELNMLHARDVVFKRETPTDITGFWCGTALRRILQNLVKNAIKYDGAQQPIIVHLNQNETSVSCSVHNTASYIPKEDHDKIFEPFYRRSGTEESKKEGWGLGLALVKALVEAHGGNISVTSNEQEGTTFTVTLPRKSVVS